ncbi:MAG: hypothetical protein EA401_10480 [Planctomycetota bacterium]|nr:MAG: hypothetical protein EA401_10480 [Planctomycetota bacterium]
MVGINTLSDEQWQAALPSLRTTFHRLTEADLRDCGQRLDLLTGKVQNRHWLDRITAQRQVLQVVRAALEGSPQT